VLIGDGRDVVGKNLQQIVLRHELRLFPLLAATVRQKPLGSAKDHPIGPQLPLNGSCPEQIGIRC